MKKTLAEFKEGKIGLNKIAGNIPRRSFKRRVQRNVCDRMKKSINDLETDLPEEIQELDQHILTFEENMFGINITNVRKLALETSELSEVNHRFNINKKCLGKNSFIYS